MEKIVNNFYKSKSVSVFFLLILWIFLTLWSVIVFDTSTSIWSYNHSNSDIKNVNYDLFKKGQTYRGEFIAQDNNLGIVSIRFQTYIRPPYKYEDLYLFRIREKGKDWHYENTYRSGLIYDVPFFPFGFPIIKDSKGKTYELELSTLNTNEVNRISISKRYPILQSKYKYSRDMLLANNESMIEFLKLKFINAIKTPDLVFSSLIYLLPFILYISWITYLNKFIRLENYIRPIANKLKKYYKKVKVQPIGFLLELNFILFLIIILDIFVFQIKNDIAYMIVLILWLTSIRSNDHNVKPSLIFSLTLIAVCSPLLLLEAEPTAEKAATWGFITLLSSFIYILFKRE